MGLDMYLHRKLDSLDGLLHCDIDAAAGLSQNVVSQLLHPLDPNDIDHGPDVDVTAITWHKANQIHKWFVDHVQAGNDDCDSYYVSAEALVELKQACADVLANPKLVRDILPPCDGFFFGDTDIDDVYYDEVRRTYDLLSKELALTDALTKINSTLVVEYSYHASW